MGHSKWQTSRESLLNKYVGTPYEWGPALPPINFTQLIKDLDSRRTMKGKPMTEWYLSIEVLEDKNAAVAMLSFQKDYDSDNHVVTGSSKRDKEDPFIPGRGGELAIARALRKLANELEGKHRG